MIKIDVMCKSNHWPVRFKKVKSIVKKILLFKKDLAFNDSFDYNCNIILLNNKLIKKMNYKFRNKKKYTDVLTFVSDINLKDKRKIKICDVLLAAEIIKKDAQKNKISFYDHLTHLIVHSFLHLNGFTHKKIGSFNKMKNIEIKVLKKMGINNPYLYN